MVTQRGLKQCDRRRAVRNLPRGATAVRILRSPITTIRLQLFWHRVMWVFVVHGGSQPGQIRFGAATFSQTNWRFIFMINEVFNPRAGFSTFIEWGNDLRDEGWDFSSRITRLSK